MTAAARRAEALADDRLEGRAYAEALSSTTDAWASELFEQALDGRDPKGIALVATGGTGRGDLCPGSDVDLLLLHKLRRGVGDVADRLWYPFWDAGVKLGHSVRTPKETLALVRGGDLETMTGLLDATLLAGDQSIFDELLSEIRRRWVKDARVWLGRLAEANRERHDALGEVAFLLEPDLKDGRGGLRDVHTLGWAGAAGVEIDDDDERRIAAAHDVLLRARVALHQVTSSPHNVLLLEEQDAVADRLGYADADALMGEIATSARTIEHLWDEVWIRIVEPREDDITVPPAGMTIRDGELRLLSDPAADPMLVLHAAVTAAEHDVRIDREALRVFGQRQPKFPDPWPEGARDLFVRLLLQGHHAIPVIEALDFAGVWVRVLPEWEPNRHRPQRNVYHRFTVDRHLLEAAAQAAGLAHRVSRPDLLVVGALLHDIGKGSPGDHTEVGMRLAAPIATRMGFTAEDTATIVRLVEHHLLLPDVATRRDVEDPATVKMVAEQAGSVDFLELLGELTVADSTATGPTAWGSWKAELVQRLTDNVASLLTGGQPAPGDHRAFITPEIDALMAAGESAVVGEGDVLTVVSPDRPGLFSRTAGVLAFNGLGVLQANAYSSHAGMAVSQFQIVEPADPVDWPSVCADVRLALRGRLAIDARIAERRRVYRRRSALAASAPVTSVLFDAEVATDATVIEVTTADRIGVLHSLTRVLAYMGLDIRYAKIQTLSHEIVDTFYVRADDGPSLDPAYQDEIETAIRHALSLLD